MGIIIKVVSMLKGMDKSKESSSEENCTGLGENSEGK